MEMNDDIKNAFDTLERGGLILYPTDTIWGIGCDATDEKAVQRVYELKKRIESKAMIILVDNDVKLNFYVRQVPDLAYDLIDMSEKPLTIIYDEGRNLAPNLLAEDGSVAIRVTREKFSNQLCRKFRKAIVSTSANVSGTIAPTNFDDISDEIKAGVDYIVNFRQSDKIKHHASSVIKLKLGGEIKIIRE